MTRVLIVVLLVVGTARADDRAAAERYFRAGSRAYAAQNFAAAATNFDEAYKALPMPEIAFSAAQAYRRLYQIDPKPQFVRRAVELYKVYLGAVKKGGRVGDAADNLADMKRELDKLEAAGVATTAAAPATPKTRFGVNVSVPDQAKTELGALSELGDATGAIDGLTVTIDGGKVEPFTLIELPAKEHVVHVVANGYFAVDKKTVAVEGQSTLVDVELKPRPAKVAVTTEADARITVDGRMVATAPTPAIELPAGKHLIAVLRDGREPFGKEIAVARGEQLMLSAPLAKTTRRKIAPWVIAGAGLFAGGAVATALLANARDQRATELRDQIAMGNRPPSDADEYDRLVGDRDRFMTSTWILGGAALASGTVGGLMLVFDSPSSIGVAGRF